MYADRVKETSSTEGNGNFVLSGTQTGFQKFLDAFIDGQTVAYCIEHESSGEWEVG